MSEQLWRDLGPDEFHEIGDRSLCKYGYDGSGCIRQRPVPAPEPLRWIPLSERKPTAEDVVHFAVILKNDYVTVQQGAVEGWVDGVEYWHPLPKLPPAPDPDKEAFEKWIDQRANLAWNKIVHEQTWQAALAYRDGKAK